MKHTHRVYTVTPHRVPCPDEVCHAKGHSWAKNFMLEFDHRTLHWGTCFHCGASEVYLFSKKQTEKMEREWRLKHTHT